jgi:hypothetical protein
MNDNLYIAFACKKCRRWVANDKRNAPLDSKKDLISFVRKISCKCPVCKKSSKLYDKRVGKDNSNYRLFNNPIDRSEFIKTKNGENSNACFVTFN